MSDNPIFSYTRRDYEGSRKEGMAKIPILSKGLWTDLNAGDPGVTLLDYMHALADLCNYYLDHQALEAFISTAKERENILRHAQNATYKARAAKGASVDVRMYINLETEFNTVVTVPKGTVLDSTVNGVVYRTDEDCIITESQVGYSVPCTQGEVTTETYQGTGVSSLVYYPTDEYVVHYDQQYVLQGTGVDIDTIQIVDATGVIWEQVDFIAFVDTASKVYQVVVGADHRVTIKFGNGVRGYSPAESDVLTITYVNTMGDEGGVIEKEINGNITVEGSDAQDYVVFYYNPYPSTGGSYGESDEELKRNIISYKKTLGRAVTREDFEDLALMIDGVKSVRVYDINTAPDLCLYHEVKIYVLPEDTVNGSVSLMNKITSYLKERSIPPTNVLVYYPTQRTINITIDVRRKPYLVEGEVTPKDEVEQYVEEYFNNEVEIGEPFNPLSLSTYLTQRLTTVSSILSINPSTPVEVGETGIPALGTLTINVR